ncbi:MAG: hypothetical protein F4X22_16300 [Gemmatimonadales bacterium]|uniref:hypothetical protein n=1 Tax=Candidatus Palauibacter polyketidifaciens TaxID=3056740 RepID=UPI0013F71B45|nr:hypothetical protein [Candidatus Palauibacter polyketidifaciens]MDE2721288.1 hypothetical protein [Candidatus Palauibacter polyketidifaciens]MYC89770.1 hypothetical protein [Candidatus Palauibacter denitrificans]
MIAICCTAWIAANGRVSAQAGRLVLTESGRHVMPGHILVRGGALSPRGDASLFWSGDTVWVASTRHAEARAVCPERIRAPLGAAFVSTPAAGGAPVIEIIDGGMAGADEPRIIRFSDDQCRATAWTGPDPSLPAARDAAGWVSASGTDRGGSDGIPTTRVSLVRDGGTPFSASSVDLPIAWSDSVAISVSSGPNGIIVSSRQFPFAWSAAADGSDRTPAGRIPAGNETYYASDPWIGTGVFALDSGFVQVLADLASDRRHLVFYDSSGAFRRRRVIDVPFGILDTSPYRRQLLAVRRTDRVEILTYEWTWQPPRARD